jgi:cyclophilin family peptidyl-prolyl cis-trans isomerase
MYLAHSNFWTGVRIFRIVPNFVSQFGISSYPNEGWSDVETLLDDPPRLSISNTIGTVTFATISGPNTRTTQVFINTANNEYLDNQGFTPIGEVIMAGDGYGGMDVVQEFYSGYGERPDQKKIKTFGEEYLIQEFPLLSYLVSAEVVSN